VSSWTAQPASRWTTSASATSSDPGPIPVCTGFTTTSDPFAAARRANAAVAIVLPTPVSVPVTTRITG